MLLGLILALLLLGYGFGYDKWQPPPRQPEQMSSKVNYDPKLRDKFFESDLWSCPGGTEEPVACRDGKPVLILKDPCDSWLSLFVEGMCGDLREWTCPDGCKECATCRDGRPVLRNTARCYSTSYGSKHPVNFCEAKLLDEHAMDLLFHKKTPAFDDSLLVRIRNGKFSCQYWIVRDFGALTYTTTRQMLILDKKVYKKGDVIKGKIDFECVSKHIDPINIEILKKKGEKLSRTIKVFGVFKTMVK
jgi:hypothetical protein